MSRHGIPTARYQTFTDADAAAAFIHNAPFAAHVVKASGLAAGKGVVVAAADAEAVAAVRHMFAGAFGSASATVVVEEKLQGPEVSLLAFCDGRAAFAMPPAQDHKRLEENDGGPNTGGMGAYAPCPLLDAAAQAAVMKTVVQVRGGEGGQHPHKHRHTQQRGEGAACCALHPVSNNALAYRRALPLSHALPTPHPAPP